MRSHSRYRPSSTAGVSRRPGQGQASGMPRKQLQRMLSAAYAILAFPPRLHCPQCQTLIHPYRHGHSRHRCRPITQAQRISGRHFRIRGGTARQTTRARSPRRILLLRVSRQTRGATDRGRNQKSCGPHLSPPGRRRSRATARWAVQGVTTNRTSIKLTSCWPWGSARLRGSCIASNGPMAVWTRQWKCFWRGRTDARCQTLFFYSRELTQSSVILDLPG